MSDTDALLKRMDNLELVLGTLISWLVRELGEDAAQQLLNQVNNGGRP